MFFLKSFKEFMESENLLHPIEVNQQSLTSKSHSYEKNIIPRAYAACCSAGLGRGR